MPFAHDDHTLACGSFQFNFMDRSDLIPVFPLPDYPMSPVIAESPPAEEK